MFFPSSLPPPSLLLSLLHTHTPTHRATTRHTSTPHNVMSARCSECQSAEIHTCVSGGSDQGSLKVAECVAIKELTRIDGSKRFGMSPSAVWRKPLHKKQDWDNQGGEILLSLAFASVCVCVCLHVYMCVVSVCVKCKFHITAFENYGVRDNTVMWRVWLKRHLY